MRINYESVRRDAQKLRRLAGECETAAKTCSKCQNELPQYWQGGAADSYAAGLAQLNRKNRMLAGEIEQLAAQIIAVANELEEEDRRLAAKIAARRTGSAASAAGGANGKMVSSRVSAVSKVASAATDAIGQAAKKTAKSNTSTILQAATGLLSKLFGKG